MKITKSSRHSKITGDFAERLVLYWLSKYGFECAFVDHVGLDIIARNPHTRELMGISVKSRSRNAGTEQTYLGIPNDNLVKLDHACISFGCVPYFAVVIDAADTIRCYIVSKAHLLKVCPPGEKIVTWSMVRTATEKYELDENIKQFQFVTGTAKWWTDQGPGQIV